MFALTLLTMGLMVMIMAEYIKREALMKELSESVEPFNTGSVFRAIRKQLAADVAPVVHGRWIEYPYAHYFKCSECKCPVPYKKAVLTNGKRKYNHCPNFGARMDGDANNE